MYKVTVNIGAWDCDESEKVVIETSDFEKAKIILEFIDFQKEFGWDADYQLSDEFIDAQCDEEDEVNDETDSDEENGEYEIGETVEDEDGLLWERVA